VLWVQLADKTGGCGTGNAVAEYGDVHGSTVCWVANIRKGWG
jgi:hypothetical protein